MWTNILRFLLHFAPTPIPWITRSTGEKDQPGMFPQDPEIIVLIPRMGPVPDMDIHLKETGKDHHLDKGEVT